MTEAATRRLREVETVPARALLPGTIVDAWVDYEDGRGWKRRPAVVLIAKRRAVEIVPCTTSPRKLALNSSIRLEVDDETGLRETSAVLPHCITVDRGSVLNIRGHCPDDTLRLIVASIARADLRTSEMIALPAMTS